MKNNLELSTIKQIIRQKTESLETEDIELSGFTIEDNKKKRKILPDNEEFKTQQLMQEIENKIDQYNNWLNKNKEFVKKIKVQKKKFIKGRKKKGII